MEAEFCLMCGDDATKKVAENWAKYVPKILEHGGIEEGTIMYAYNLFLYTYCMHV